MSTTGSPNPDGSPCKHTPHSLGIQKNKLNTPIPKFQEWYTSLSTFGYLPSESESSLASDPDHRLMSLIVEKVVLPKISAVVNCSYDPMSTTQTLRDVKGIRIIFNFVFPDKCQIGFHLQILKLQGHRATEQVPRRVPDAQRGVEAGQRPHDCGEGQDQDIGRAGPVHSHWIRETVSENDLHFNFHIKC